MGSIRRVNVNFSESAYKDLVDLADRKGKTVSDVLREAVALERWFEDTTRDGNRVLVEREGQLREIVPR